MADGGNDLNEYSRKPHDPIDDVFEENISVENLLQSSLPNVNKTASRSVTFNDLNYDVDSDVLTENGSNYDDSESVTSDKGNTDDDLKSSFQRLTMSMSSVAQKIRAPIDKLRNSQKTRNESKQNKSPVIDLSSVKIDKLPQLFVAKYLGKRKCKEIIGKSAPRKHVDNMMKTIMKHLDNNGDIELPLKYLIVSTKGLHFREHPMNAVKGEDDLLDISLESISYCVQDMKYWRVFTYILVKELSSRNHVAECHAFLCDTPVCARKMVVSLAAAFKIRVKNLKLEGLDKQTFSVELRTPTQLKNSIDEDCDV